MTGTWLWLFGPPGVGKSATGFQLFQRLAESGERIAFVEIDQIGMCMPAPDSARSAAKADNLLAVLDNFAAAGACAIVAGDIGEAMNDVVALSPTRPVLCRLRADDQVTAERLTARGGPQLANVSACWAGFRRQGAERLLLCGHADDREVSALRGVFSSLRIVALTARSDTLFERARQRREHRDVELPGDDLFGEGDDHLRDVVVVSQTCASDDADLTIATDTLQPIDIAARISPLWPPTA